MEKPKRKSPEGSPTNELILSAHAGTNSDVFPLILELYLPIGSSVADVTYGKGVFWRNVDLNNYILKHTDIRDGVDCRKLPYKRGSLDCVVLDPPYMHTPGSAHNGHQNFESYYRNNGTPGGAKKYHDAVLDLYYQAGAEAKRVLREGGIFIVKCQDTVCSNQQRLTHVELINKYSSAGFIVEDLFVVVRNNRPGVSRVKEQQRHARKNHSYFLVLRKRRPRPRTKH